MSQSDLFIIFKLECGPAAGVSNPNRSLTRCYLTPGYTHDIIQADRSLPDGTSGPPPHTSASAFQVSVPTLIALCALVAMFNCDGSYLFFLLLSIVSDALDHFLGEADDIQEVVLKEAQQECFKERFAIMNNMATDFILEEHGPATEDILSIMGQNRRLKVTVGWATIDIEIPSEVDVARCIVKHGDEYAEFAQEQREARVRRNKY